MSWLAKRSNSIGMVAWIVVGSFLVEAKSLAGEQAQGQALLEDLKLTRTEVIRESEKDENYSFLGVSTLAVDSEGRIYLLDYKGGSRQSGGGVIQFRRASGVVQPSRDTSVSGRFRSFLLSVIAG